MQQQHLSLSLSICRTKDGESPILGPYYVCYRLIAAVKDAKKPKGRASNTASAEVSPQLVNQDDSQSSYERCIDGTDGNGNDNTIIAATHRIKDGKILVVDSPPESRQDKTNPVQSVAQLEKAKVDSNAADKRIHRSNFSSQFDDVADKCPVSPSDITSQFNFGDLSALQDGQASDDAFEYMTTSFQASDYVFEYMTTAFHEEDSANGGCKQLLVINSLCRNFL